MRLVQGNAICLLALLFGTGAAFVPEARSNGVVKQHSATKMGVASSPDFGSEVDSRSFVMPKEEVSPIVSFGEGDKEKVVNLYGMWCLFVSLITGPIWMAAMKIVHRMENDTHRSLYDKTGKIWSKTWLTMTNSFPEITGDVDRLKKGKGACLYVANHASWLDIPVLCTVLDPVFKFISKKELENVPCIGTQLSGGEHILIDRDDRRSQLKSFKAGIGWLKKGVPLMAFPEGQRSKDGHLMDFKGGLFLMAAKTKVPIVPITLSHTHAVMPSNALFPVQSGAGKLRVHVHEPITAEGKTEDELAELVKASFLKTLPLEQHPLEPMPSIEELEALSSETASTTKKNETVAV